jgi:cyclopropane fatty-acyl-phospholipid synthase-like methyltransferase
VSQKKYYQKHWNIDKVEKKVKNEPFRKQEPDVEVVKFLKFLKKKKVRGNLLDVGCGGGRHCLLFSKNGFETTGFDFSSNAIKIAKQLSKKSKFKVASVLKYKDNNNYDVVLDYGCLHHIPKSKWAAYKKTILNASKKGTYFFLFGYSKNSEYLRDYKLSSFNKTKRFLRLEGDYFRFFSISEIKKLFPEFEIVFKSEKKTLSKNTSFYTFYLKRK